MHTNAHTCAFSIVNLLFKIALGIRLATGHFSAGQGGTEEVGPSLSGFFDHIRLL